VVERPIPGELRYACVAVMLDIQQSADFGAAIELDDHPRIA
jgi:hypothetical protein